MAMALLNRLFKRAAIYEAGTVPFIRQQQPGGDGLACIAMIFAFHGVAIDLDRLVKGYFQFSQGIGLRDIIAILEELDLVVRALQCPARELHNLQMPCILHWDMKQFVVLKDIQEYRFTVVDPASKKLTLSLDEFEQHFGEIVLEVRNKYSGI